jgi:cell division protein FtsI/penicillin-binding protein 2
MVVYEGARPQPFALTRRRQPVPMRAGRRTSRVGLALAGILVAFLLGLFYLTQTVHVAATNYDIGALAEERDRMSQQLQSLQGDIALLGAELAVGRRAQELGLNPLGAAVWVPAREPAMLGRVSSRRLIVVLVLLLVFGAAAVMRLAYWQVVVQDRLVAVAHARLDVETVQPARRGSVYDRTGTILLATTIYRDQLVAYPSQVPAEKRSALAIRLAGILGLKGDQARTLASNLKAGSGYAILASGLTPAQSDAVRAALADGTVAAVDLVPRPVRVYPNPGGAPNTSLASHLLGFVNADGDGQYGIEQRYQGLLAGRARVVVNSGVADAGDSTDVREPGAPGLDLRLTIDAGLQLQVEKELHAAWVADRARSVSAIVMNAANGEILAWATVPAYDANAYGEMAETDPSRFIDPIAAQIYEPGSVMKTFVAAAGYQAKVLKPTTKINDSGTLKIGPNQVDDADRKAMGVMPFRDVIAYSRNVGAARAAAMLGKSVRSASVVLYRMWTKLGIGLPTEIDVAGEVTGIVDDPAITSWAAIDLANRSFGQGVAVTLVQLARSYAAMVNGGYLVQPHIAAAIGDREIERPERTRVITATISKNLVSLLKYVASSPWYAKGTLIKGYLVGGKTGTAQIWDAKRREWIDNVFNFTFVGFLGRTKPEYVVTVRIERARPEVVRQGVLRQPIASHELFRRIAISTIRVLDLAPAGSAASGASPEPGATDRPTATPDGAAGPTPRAATQPPAVSTPPAVPAASPSNDLPGWAP